MAEKSGLPAVGKGRLGIEPGDQVIHKGERIDLVLRKVRLNSGKERVREVCVHPGAVIILPLTEQGEIVMIRNRRHTVFEELLELPAGTLERDALGVTEDPARCAARELKEETGYTAREIEAFGWIYTSPGILTEKMYVFVARGLEKGEQALEENEQIQVEVMAAERVVALICENRIVDAKTIAVVLKYGVGGRWGKG